MIIRLNKYFLISLLLTIPLTQIAWGQVTQNRKEYKCMDQQIYATYDLLKTTRSYGNYDPQNEWSQELTSDQIVRKSVELEGGRQYAILLVTRKDVAATGVEIRDQYGFQLEYVYKVNELDKGQINVFYTPDVDGIYQVFYRVVDTTPVCSFMAVLKGDLDPEFGIDEDDDDNRK